MVFFLIFIVCSVCAICLASFFIKKIIRREKDYIPTTRNVIVNVDKRLVDFARGTQR